MNKKKILKILIIILVTFILFAIGMELWQKNWNIPFSYCGSDDFVWAMHPKRAVSGQLNYWTDSRLAAPYTQEMYGFPYWSPFYYTFCLLIGVFTDNYIHSMNLFYFCTYLFSMLSVVYLLRKLKIRFAYALLGGITFSFCQYHFFHGMAGRTSATQIFVIPIFSLLIYNIISGEYSLKFLNRGDRICNFLCWFGLCALIGTVDTFYTLFGCWLMLIVSIYCLINGKRKDAILALISVVTVFLVLLVSLSTPLITSLSDNIKIQTRSPYDAYYWALQLISLFIPQATSHPLSFITNAHINVAGVPKGENLCNYLGIIGIVGFFLMILAIMKNEKNREGFLWKIKPWGIINVFAILLGTVGGGGFIIALIINPILRTYTRIFPFILLFCVISSMLLIEHLSNKKACSNRFCVFVTIILIVLHVFDCNLINMQHNIYNTQYHIYNHEQYEIDKNFIQSIEAKFNESAKILQLPYLQFPENSIVTQRGRFSNVNVHLKGYLHSSSLCWSYGALPQSPGDRLQIAMSDARVDDMIKVAWDMGFMGIYVDTDLFETREKADEIVQELSKLVDDNPLISAYGKMYFFDMRSNTFQKSIPFEPTGIFIFEDGFYYEERISAGKTWRWSNQTSSLSVYCLGENSMEFELSGASGTVIISIGGEKYGEYSIDGNIVQSVLLPLYDGINKITFEATGNRVNAPVDHRSIYFMLQNYRLAHVAFPFIPQNGELVFGIGGNESDYIRRGFSGPEQGFRWTDGSFSSISFKTHNNVDLELVFSIMPYTAGDTITQHVGVWVNETKIEDWEIDSPVQKEISLSADLSNRNNYTVAFTLPDAASPKDFGESEDGRKLGLALYRIVFNEK